MTAKSKKILIYAIIAAVCAIAVTVTLVLILTRDGDGHVKIEDGVQNVKGELDVVLKRERLTSVTLDGNGLQRLFTDNRIYDFSNTRDNVFGITENTLVAPRCYFEADMTVANAKPYSFEYWLEITPANGKNLLAEQIMLTVTVGDEIFVRRTLQDGLQTKVLPAVASGSTASFTVKLEYLDVHDNDKTQNSTLAFDMIVHARLTESHKEGV